MTDKEIIEFWEHITELAESCDPTARIPLSVGSAKETYRLIKRLKRESNKYRNKAKTQKGELRRLYKQNAEYKAEIERLQKVIETMTNEQLQFGFEAKSKIEKAKAEAIKEFAKRLKKQIGYEESPMVSSYLENTINNLVKEMVGDVE